MNERLTRIERLLLYNQFLILSQLNTENDSYKKCCEILHHGWTAEYHRVFDSIDSDELSEARTKYLLDVLTMHEILERSYAQLDEKSGIDPTLIQFFGFDNNHELDLIAYAKHLKQNTGWREFLKNKTLSIHRNTEERYRHMLQRWEVSSDKVNLIKEDIQRIIAVESISASAR